MIFSALRGPGGATSTGCCSGACSAPSSCGPVFIFAGVALLDRFTWLVLVFGAFLVFTGVRVGAQDEGEVHPERNPVLKLRADASSR